MHLSCCRRRWDNRVGVESILQPIFEMLYTSVTKNSKYFPSLIRWVLNTMDKLGMSTEDMPTLYLVPLGTGNDLARTLGFGPGADGSLNVKDVMRQIANEQITTDTLLDRWKVNVVPKTYYGKKKKRPKSLYILKL